MDKEKQIDEMAKLICTYPQCIHYNIIGECANTECQTVDIAENLYNKGYRKASKIAEEVIDEIFKILDAEYRQYDTVMLSDTLNKMYMSSRNTVIKITAELAELKKKYAEEKDNV